MYRDILAALERKEPPPSPNMRAAFTRAIVESYDSQRAAALVERFRKNDAWQCPTLVVLHTLWADGQTLSRRVCRSTSLQTCAAGTTA